MTNNRNNQGTGFTNFNDILNANQGSGQRMGQAIAGGLESQGQAVNKNLNDAQNEFNTGYNTGSAGANSAIDASTNFLKNTGTGTDATSIGANLRNAAYTGPQGLKGASGLKAQAQSATDAGNSAGNAQGQQQLLGQYVGGRGYNQGQAQFDQALLDKYGNSAINQAKKGLVGLGERTNNVAKNAENLAGREGQYIGNQKMDLQKQAADQGAALLDKGNQQASDFSALVDRFQKNVSGKGGTETPDQMKQDQQFLADFQSGKYGNLSNLGNIYTHNSNPLQYTNQGYNDVLGNGRNLDTDLTANNTDIANELSSGWHVPTGGPMFNQGEQLNSANNLNAFLGNKLPAYTYQDPSTFYNSSNLNTSINKENADYGNSQKELTDRLAAATDLNNSVNVAGNSQNMNQSAHLGDASGHILKDLQAFGISPGAASSLTYNDIRNIMGGEQQRIANLNNTHTTQGFNDWLKNHYGKA